ncbi:hypothetical protein EMIT0P12_70172 [Pseudomonas sp. IT-P12]
MIDATPFRFAACVVPELQRPCRQLHHPPVEQTRAGRRGRDRPGQRRAGTDRPLPGQTGFGGQGAGQLAGHRRRAADGQAWRAVHQQRRSRLQLHRRHQEIPGTAHHPEKHPAGQPGSEQPQAHRTRAGRADRRLPHLQPEHAEQPAAGQAGQWPAVEQVRCASVLQRRGAQSPLRPGFRRARRHTDQDTRRRQGDPDRQLLLQWQHRVRRPRAGLHQHVLSHVEDRREGRPTAGPRRGGREGRRHRPGDRTAHALECQPERCAGGSGDFYRGVPALNFVVRRLASSRAGSLPQGDVIKGGSEPACDEASKGTGFQLRSFQSLRNHWEYSRYLKQ